MSCIISCQCFDRFHEPEIQALKAFLNDTPKVSFVRCEQQCSHFDCLSVDRTFAPAPRVSPWAVDSSPLQFELEGRDRLLRRRELARARLEEARKPRFRVPLHSWRLPQGIFLQYDVSEAHEKLGERNLARFRSWEARASRFNRPVPTTPKKPAFLEIAGISCPPIRGKWLPYMRKSGETRLDHHRRVKDMVAAIKLGRQLREQERREELDPLAVLKMELAEEGLRLCSNLFEPLREELLEGQASNYVWPKTRVGRHVYTAKVVDVRHQQWCERNLKRKLELAQFQEAFVNSRALRHKRFRSVVHIDSKTHTCWSLKSRMINMFREMVEQNPEVFLNDSVQGEMDDGQKNAHGEKNEPKSVQKSNVVLEQQEASSVSKALPSTKAEDEYSCFAATSTPKTTESYTNRWITVHQGVWPNNKKMNDELFKLVLPKDVLENKKFQNAPNYAPFRVNTLWRGNMKVMITVNSNARQYGQFQVRFYYGAYFDKNSDLRDNIFIGSQMPHILVNASTSNSGELNIPFEYFNPLLSVTKGEQTWDTPPDDGLAMNLGTLYAKVIVPLTVASTTPGQCTYSVLIAFEDSQFNGLVDSRLIANSLKLEAQMFPIAAAFALTELQNIFDNNRDNPTLSFTGMPVFPVNAGSWCIGNGLAEWTNVLRLNPQGQTPYAQGRVPSVDEMKIDYVKKIFGMFKILHWSVSQSPGALLYKFDASPLFTITDYPQMKSGSDTVLCLPPIAVLTSMFAWWRGSLKLRIDVVGGTELTGRLLVAYIPKFYKDVSMDIAINCTHTIFDLQTTNRQFNFEIPFFSDKLFWERAKNLKDVYEQMPPPGTVYLFVYNELIPNSTIPSDCELVLYIAGGEDFEVSVPALPVIGTGFFPTIERTPASVGRIVSKAGYFPVYIGTWDHLSALVPVYRYGAVSQHIAQFTTNWGNLYKVAYIDPACKPDDTKHMYELNLRLTYGDSDIVDNNYRAICRYLIAIKNSGYIYAIPLPIIKFSTAMANMIKPQIKSLQAKVDASRDIDLSRFSQWWEYLWGQLTAGEFLECMNPGFRPAVASRKDGKDLTAVEVRAFVSPSEYFTPSTALIADVVSNLVPTMEAQAGDEKSSQETKPSRPLKTACGRKAAVQVFGERFHDLKDVCRRYQLYASGDVKVKEHHLVSRVIVLKFPAVPQGLDLVTKDGDVIRQYWNRTREGPIPLVASGYRYFTGSLRFRVVFNSVLSDTQELTAKVFVQHRPDVYMDDFLVEERSQQDIGTDDIEHPGYATYHQIDTINNVICFEVPFYLPIVRSILQRPIDTFKKWHNLGQIAMGITLPQQANSLRYEIYYSLGDDARFSVFCGFPPMIDITDIAPSKVSGAAGNAIDIACDGIFKSTRTLKGRATAINANTTFIKQNWRKECPKQDDDDDLTSEFEEVQGEMFESVWNYLPGNNMSRAADVVSKIDPEKANAAFENISETTSLFSKFKDTVMNVVPTFDSLKHRIEKYMSLIVNVVTNFIHCLLHLNIKTITVSIISILTQIKIVSLNAVSSLSESLAKLFNTITSRQHEGEVVVGEMMEEDEEPFNIKDHLTEERNCTAAYISTLIAGVAATLALGAKLSSSNFKSVFLILFDSIKSFAMTANHLFTFVKNNLICIQKIGNWLVDDSPKMKDIQFLKEQNESIYKWALEAIELIDPWKEDELFMNVRKSSRVHVLQFGGSLILLNLGNCKIDPQQYRVIEKIFERLSQLKERLVKAHKAPPVRFEPFVYELTGPTGVGKSELLNRIPFELLKHINVKVRGEVIYHRALGNPHWNNCRNQPICSIDEKFPIQQPGFADVQIAELFQLKSRCIFNPPMADLPDKNLRYNPLIVQYASNNAFPKLTGILDQDAINRRRDCLIRVKIAEHLLRNNRNLTIDQLTYDQRRNFNCLRFQFANDKLDRMTTWSEEYNYERFLERLKDIWFDYYRREEAMFQQHLNRALELAPNDGETLETFEGRWREMCDMRTGEDEIRRFRDEYAELLRLHKEKKDHPLDREAKSFNLIRKYFNKDKDTSQLDLHEIKVRINTLRKTLKDHKEEIIDGKPVGQGDDVTLPRTAASDHYQEIADRVRTMKTRDGLCHHHLVWEMLNSKSDASLIQFNSKDQAYEIHKDSIENFLHNLCIRMTIPISWFLEEQDICQYLINHNPCHKETCPFNDFDNRMLCAKLLIDASPTCSGFVASLQLENLKDRCPREYLNHLEKKIKSAKKIDMTELREEVTKIDSWYVRAKDALMSIEWKKWFQRIALIIGFLFFVGILLKVLWFGSSSSAEGLAACGSAVVLAKGEVHASGDFKQGAVKKETPRVVASKTLQAFPEAHMGLNLQNSVYGSLERNTFCLSMYDENGEVLMGRCLGISGNYALLVDHYWDAWKNFSYEKGTTSMHFIPCSSRCPTAIKVDFNELVYTKFENSALGLLKLPLRLACFKDIRRKIASKATHVYVNGLGCIAEATNGSGSDSDKIFWRFHSIKFSKSPRMTVRGGQFFSDFETSDCYKYPDFHGKGRCGSVLLCADLPTPIVGVHIAGTSEGPKYGFSEIIYREMFDHLPNAAPPRASSIAEGQGSSDWYIDGEVIGIGKVGSMFAHRANEKSRIIPSKVQEDPESPFPVYTELAVLSPKDPRIQNDPFSPMLEGCKHHGKPLKPFNCVDLKEAMEDYENLVLSKCIPQRVEVGLLPLDVVINGIDGKDGYEHIEWNSSEGFPFVAERPKGAHNKKWMFNFDDNGKCIGINENCSLLKVLKEKWHLRNNNIIPETVFTDCLKDCRIAKEKVLEPGKTRIFSVSPVDFTIHQRMCTLDFVVAFMACRLDLEHAVGINPDGFEWASLAQQLLTVGDNIVTGDYSKFGDTIPPEILHGFFKMVIKWYKKHGNLTWEHQKQLEIMAFEIGNSIHLMFDFLYQVICGQPSGNSLTVIINSYANSIYLRLAWLSIMRYTKYCGLEYFHKYVKNYSYGDDLIVSISEIIKDLFNAQFLCLFFKKYNLKFTNADKSDEIVPYVNLSKADFLKRGFLVHPKRKMPLAILAPLKEESIVDTINWVNKDSFGLSNPQCQNFEDMSIQVCEDALRNAFGRGPEYYENFRQKLREFWQRHNVNFVSSDWDTLDVRCFDLNLAICPFYTKFSFKISQ
ncbi:polyprotein [Nephila clavipes virus 1]|uniref:polyprotein n=1 Tax=Nephila clavipes virus 1 TaxID=2108204 RepID=UPI000D1FEF3D|nr:polyprotein [Nephila clavipes virus 1]AVK59473.1 polyprotein [Nephila clavipes virus 1]